MSDRLHSAIKDLASTSAKGRLKCNSLGVPFRRAFGRVSKLISAAYKVITTPEVPHPWTPRSITTLILNMSAQAKMKTRRMTKLTSPCIKVNFIIYYFYKTFANTCTHLHQGGFHYLLLLVYEACANTCTHLCDKFPLGGSEDAYSGWILNWHQTVSLMADCVFKSKREKKYPFHRFLVPINDVT